MLSRPVTFAIFTASSCSYFILFCSFIFYITSPSFSFPLYESVHWWLMESNSCFKRMCFCDHLVSGEFGCASTVFIAARKSWSSVLQMKRKSSQTTLLTALVLLFNRDKTGYALWCGLCKQRHDMLPSME